MAAVPTVLLDPAAAWDAMSADMQRRIGVTALVAALGEAGAMGSLGHEAALDAGLAALCGLVMEHLDLDPGQEPPRPDLAAIGVRACRSCGCTDAVGCPEGCSWAGDTLCTRCAPVRLGVVRLKRDRFWP